MPDTIRIRDLDVRCVVGVYRHERDVPQPLRVDLELQADTTRAAEHERLRDTLDYAQIAAQVAFLLESCRFRLLETAAHTLARVLLAPPAIGERRAAIDALTLTLTKPDALGGRATPSLTITRRAEGIQFVQEEKPFGTVDVVHETRDAGVYRLNIGPGRGIPLHVHRVMREAELLLGDGLLVNGRAMKPGTIHRWPHDAPHRYDNPTDRWQTVLCVDSPRFAPEDEIEVQGEPAEVPSDTTWCAP